MSLFKVPQPKAGICESDPCHLSVCGSGSGYGSTKLFWFGEGAQLFCVDIPQLLQLPLASPVQILDVHHVRLLDASVHSKLIADSGDEARFVPASSQELPVQSQDLLLQLAVPRHVKERRLHLMMLRLGRLSAPVHHSCDPFSEAV